MVKDNINAEPCNKFSKRIWTTDSFNNYEKNDEFLEIIHLPAEKKYGFHRIYKHILINQNSSIFLKNKEYFDFIGNYIDFTPSNISRTIRWARHKIYSLIKIIVVTTKKHLEYN